MKNFCITCKWCKEHNIDAYTYGYYCHHPKYKRQNTVTGKIEQREFKCSDIRNDDEDCPNWIDGNLWQKFRNKYLTWW